MRRILTEPLLHFLLIGLGLFLLYRAVNPGSLADRKIVVDDATVAMLAQRYSSVWLRPPTPAELQSLVDTFVREEILFREGVALGLDRNDPVIQRRVLQKLEVLNEETAALAPPTDAELEAYLQAHAQRYAVPPSAAFAQILFDPVRHGDHLDAVIESARDALAAGAEPASVGDSSLLPTQMAATPLDRIARDYGREFAEALPSLPVGSWQGPVRSGFGLHLVRVDSMTAAHSPELAEVRAAVERDWENDRRNTARETHYQALLKEYDVRIETPLPDRTNQPAEVAAQ